MPRRSKYAVDFQLTARLDQRQVASAVGRARLIERLLDAEIERLAKDFATMMTVEARLLCPKDIGTLRASIQPAVHRIVTRWVAEVKANADGTAPYASYVEYGTTLMAAQPYLRPVVEKYRPLWVAAVRDARRALRSAFR